MPLRGNKPAQPSNQDGYTSFNLTKRSPSLSAGDLNNIFSPRGSLSHPTGPVGTADINGKKITVKVEATASKNTPTPATTKNNADAYTKGKVTLIGSVLSRAALGAIAGMVVGGILGIPSGTPIGMIIGAVVGAIVGAVVGVINWGVENYGHKTNNGAPENPGGWELTDHESPSGVSLKDYLVKHHEKWGPARSKIYILSDSRGC